MDLPSGAGNGEVHVTVEEAISMATKAPTEGALVAKPPLSWGADAMFVDLTQECRVPKPILDAGYQYLLGREDLLELLEFLNGKKLSSRAKAEFVIHYSLTDCTPAWIQDVPDI